MAVLFLLLVKSVGCKPEKGDVSLINAFQRLKPMEFSEVLRPVEATWSFFTPLKDMALS